MKYFDNDNKLQANHGIEHQLIAEVIAEKYDTSRYWTVVRAWRRAEFERGIDMVAVPGYGFRVLFENEKISEGVQGIGKGMRALRRSGRRIEAADPALLDEPHRRKKDHATLLVGQLVDAGRKALRQIKTVAKIEVLPRQKEG